MRKQDQHPLREYDYLNENSNIGLTYKERREHIVNHALNILARLIGIGDEYSNVTALHADTQPGKLISKTMAWKSILADIRFPKNTPIKDLTNWHQNPKYYPNMMTVVPPYINDSLVVNILASHSLQRNGSQSKLFFRMVTILKTAIRSPYIHEKKITEILELCKNNTSNNNYALWLLYAYAICSKDPVQHLTDRSESNHNFISLLNKAIPKNHPHHQYKTSIIPILGLITHSEKQVIDNPYIRYQRIKGMIKVFTPSEQHFIFMVTNLFGAQKKHPDITDEIALSNHGSLKHLVQTFFESKVGPEYLQRLEKIQQQSHTELARVLTDNIIEALPRQADPDNDDPFSEAYFDYQKSNPKPESSDILALLEKDICPDLIKSIQKIQDARSRQLKLLSMENFNRSLKILLLLFHHNERHFKTDDDVQTFDGAKYSGYRTKRSSTMRLDDYYFLKNTIHSDGLKNDIFDLLSLLEWRPTTLAGRENFTASRLPEDSYLIFEGICSQLKSDAFMSLLDDIYFPPQWLLTDSDENTDSAALKDFLLDRVAIDQPQNNLHKASYQVYNDLLFKTENNLTSEMNGTAVISQILDAYKQVARDKIENLIIHLKSSGMDSVSIYYCLLSISILPPDGTKTELAKLIESCYKEIQIDPIILSELSEVLHYPRSDLKLTSKYGSYYRNFYFQYSEQMMHDAVEKLNIQSVIDNPMFNGNINGLKSEKHLGDSNIASVSTSISFLVTATRYALHKELQSQHQELSRHSTDYKRELNLWIERTIQSTGSGHQYIEWFKSYLNPRQSTSEAISQAFLDMSTFYSEMPVSIKDSRCPKLSEICIKVYDYFRPKTLTFKVPPIVTTDWFKFILDRKPTKHIPPGASSKKELSARF